MRKHAYLIIAHNEFGILEKLVTLLDDPDNDIYVHIDKKIINFDFDKLSKLVKKSNLHFSDRIKITWGGYSQVQCEINLLKAALKGKYYYYHLLSGVDLPIKAQWEIHDFFNRHEGNEFIGYDSGFDHISYNNMKLWDRMKYYHFFRDFIGRKDNIYTAIFRITERVSLLVQAKVGINRMKKTYYYFRRGANWFSITNALASYIVAKENEIKKLFKYSLCSDEVFIHTMAYNSPFREKIIDNSLRLIDWHRGQPYTYTINDYDELINSDKFFARKFSESVDAEIVEKIYNYVCDRDNT